MDSITLQANGFRYEIRKDKKLHIDGRYIIIEFEDGYQHALVEQYGWDEDKAENEVDIVIDKALRKAGYTSTLNWEDREVFLIEDPYFSTCDVAKVLMSIFEGSKIVDQSRTRLLTKIFRIFGIRDE